MGHGESASGPILATSARRDWADRALAPFALALILMVPLIVVQVFASALGWNPLLSFSRAWPLVGEAITVNTLLDAQWHLLCIIGLLPAGIVWWQDRHVRVDVFWQHLGSTGRTRVELIGHFVFTLPFLMLSLPAAWQFTLRAWRNGEASTSGGLNDLFLVKGLLPLGLMMLGLFILADLVRMLRSRSEAGRARTLS